MNLSFIPETCLNNCLRSNVILLTTSFFQVLSISGKYSIHYSVQVGDVVLVEDESVIENEFKIAGLETLVCL